MANLRYFEIIDVSTLQRPVLLLELSTLQRPVLHLDVSTLKRHHINISTLHRPLIMPDEPGRVYTTESAASGRVYIMVSCAAPEGDYTMHHRGLYFSWSMSTLLGPEPHLNVSTLKRPVLLLGVSTIQRPVMCITWTCLHYRGRSCIWTYLRNRSLCPTWMCLHHKGPELYMDLSTLQRAVQLLEVSTLQRPALVLDESTLQWLVLLLDRIREIGSSIPRCIYCTLKFLTNAECAIKKV
jgi:hypothetical protein